jgi:hypothetical protein
MTPMATHVSDGSAPPALPLPNLPADLVDVQPARRAAGGHVDAETHQRLRRALRILVAARRRDDRGPGAGEL